MQVDRVAQRVFREGKLEGVVLLAQGGKTLYRKAFGVAERSWGQPHRPETAFRICSVTKQFTAVLVLQEVERGRLSLDASVRRYLPAFRTDAGGEITVRQLLTHSSGLPNTDTLAGFYDDPKTATLTARELVQRSLRGALEFAPGERFSYNNGDYLVLEAVLESVTGQTFAALLTERILSPLGMRRSGLLAPGAIVPHLAVGYLKEPGKPHRAEPPIRFESWRASGGMYATADDLLAFDNALLGVGRVTGGGRVALLGDELRRAFFTPDPKLGFVGLSSFPYTLELGVTRRKVTVVERRGEIGAHRMLNLLLPEEKIALMVLSNTDSVELDGLWEGKGLGAELLRAHAGG